MTESVHIAIPTLDGMVNAALAHFLCHAERLSADPGHPRTYSKTFLLGHRPVQYMRNAICRDFLEKGCDRLWMLDADIVPPAHAFALLDVDDDIVGGGMPAIGRSAGLSVKLLVFDQDDDGKWTTRDAMPDEVEKIDGVGAGCMAIRRHVIEDQRMRLEADPPEGLRDERWAPAIFRMPLEPWGEKITTSDLDFCERARRCGYSISLWPDELFGQRETLDLRDVAAYGARCAADSGRTR